MQDLCIYAWIIKHYAMKVNEEVDVQTYVFMASEPSRGEWSASRLGGCVDLGFHGLGTL
jgi:hypothetical protein